MKKLTRLTAPYTSSELNEARNALVGSNVGRVLSGLDLTHVDAVKKASGLGNISVDSNSRLRVLTDLAAIFLTTASVGDWLVLGGEIFKDDDRDREIRHTGFTNSGSPNLNDASAPFSSSDVGKIVIIYNIAAIGYGAYYIDGFVGAGAVSLAGATSLLGNETNLQYAVIDPKENWGIYEISEIIGDTQIAVDPVKEFITDQIVILNLTYSVYTPAKVTVAPGKVINQGIIVDTETSQDVNYPASWILPDAPPLVLYMRTLDERDNSPITLAISSGHYDIPGATIIATTDTSYVGAKSTWFKVAGYGLEKIRQDIDKLVSGVGQPGCHVKPFDIRINDIPWPPRLEVRYPKRNDGGHALDPVISVKNKAASVFPPGEDKYGEVVLDVPLYPPNISRQRVDKIAITSRTTRSSEYIADQSQENAGELFLTYKHGIASFFPSDEMDSDQYPISEIVPQTMVANITGVGGLCSSIKVKSNHYGNGVYVYTDTSEGGGTSTLVINGNQAEVGLAPTGDRIIVPAVADAGQIDVDVDVNGFFHIVWTENFDVFYVKVDPSGSFLVQGKTQVSSGVSAVAPKVNANIAQAVYITWFDTGSSDLMAKVVKPDGQGNLDTLSAQSSIIAGLSIEGYDAAITMDSDLLYIVAEIADQANVFVFDGQLNLIDTYAIPNDSNLGSVTSILPIFLHVERNDRDEIIAVCSGVVDDHNANATILGVRLTPSGSSRYDGYVVCDPRHAEATDPLVFGIDYLPDGGWVLLASAYSVGVPGPVVTMRLASSLQVVSSNKDSVTGVTAKEGSISFTKSRGDIVVVYVDAATDAGVIGYFDLEINGNSAIGVNGYLGDKINPVEEFDLAEVVVTRGSIPARPGVGMYLNTDATPLGSTLDVGTVDALKLVDGEIGAGLTADAQTSFGIGITSNSFVVRVIMLMDDSLSDGFSTLFDEDADIVAYGSFDNSTWVSITIEEVYRVGGRTYVVIDPSIQYNFFKVNLLADLMVPRPYGSPLSDAVTIQEIRLLGDSPFIEDSIFTSDDRRYLRGVEVRLKNLPELGPITVGDGLNSFGEFIGAEGLVQAFRESVSNTSNSDSTKAYPRGMRKVFVGKGRYRLTAPIHMPGGLNVEFEPGAEILDHLRYPNMRTVYGGGYEAPASSVLARIKSRTIHLPKSVNYLGISAGSRVYMSKTVGPFITEVNRKVVKIGNSGYTLHLDSPVGIDGSLDILKIYAPGLRIDGMKAEVEGESSYMSTNRPLLDFRLIEDLVIRDSRIEDLTPGGTAYDTVRIDDCRKVFLDNFEVSSVGARIGLFIDKCEVAKFGHALVKNSNGVAVSVTECLELYGFSNLVARGSGLPGESIYLYNVQGPFGRFSSDDPVGSGVSFGPSNDIGYDEFFNVYIHDNFIAGLINGGAYEMLLSLMMGWIQTYHSIPWTAVPGGWVDGLVTDFIVDAIAST